MSAGRTVQVAATQFACSWDLAENLDRAEQLVREAHRGGAGLVLLQELFATPYFCIEQDPGYLRLAEPADHSPLLQRFQALARELGVVLPVSFFERAHNAYFNSLAVFDADGTRLGIYRKSHIPDGPGYQEKYYFSPGDTGFRVWDTRIGRIGVGICWDQWFPEAARSMVPLAYKRTELLLAGHSRVEVIAAIKAALEKKELPALEPGAVSYMMAKSSYLTDNGGHNMPHLMFYAPIKDVAAWGANLPNSPVMAVNYWYLSEQSYPQLQSFPPIAVFLVGVDKWSDGTPAPSM